MVEAVAVPSPDSLSTRCSRRTILGSVATAALGALGGCLTRFGRRLPVAEAAESARSVPRQPDFGNDGDPFTVLTVGDRRFVVPPRDEPHSLWLWNDATAARTLPVRLSVARGETVFARDVSFPADGIFAIDLLEPADYRLELGGVAEGYSYDVDRSQFDCNDSATDIVVRTDGSVEESTITTTVGCPF